MTHKANTRKANTRKANVRNTLIATLITAAMLPTTAFADVDTITAADVDLGQFQTYSWNQKISAELSVAELAIRDAVDRELAAKGFTEVNENADLEASLSADAWSETRVDSRPPMTMRPRADRWAFMNGIEVVDVREIEQGRFDVRLSDADTAELVWHATAEGSPRSKMEKNVEEIDEAVEEMFEDFADHTATDD
ncbi:MAG: DUF4136 domain-containing protein [Acidobacteriota bacterium]